MLEENKKRGLDPQPEHGKDDNGHKDNGNEGGNGNHNGWDKKQTPSHGLVWKKY